MKHETKARDGVNQTILFMKQLTEEKIAELKKLALKSTSIENNVDDWNPFEISGGNYDDCYWVGYGDADTVNARFILDLYEINYK